MDNLTTSWGDFLQNAAGQVLDTGLSVYKSNNMPMVSIDPSTGAPYLDGQSRQPSVMPVALQGGGVSPVLLLVGVAVVALLVLR